MVELSKSQMERLSLILGRKMPQQLFSDDFRNLVKIVFGSKRRYVVQRLEEIAMLQSSKVTKEDMHHIKMSAFEKIRAEEEKGITDFLEKINPSKQAEWQITAETLHSKCLEFLQKFDSLKNTVIFYINAFPIKTEVIPLVCFIYFLYYS